MLKRDGCSSVESFVHDEVGIPAFYRHQHLEIVSDGSEEAATLASQLISYSDLKTGRRIVGIGSSCHSGSV